MYSSYPEVGPLTCAYGVVGTNRDVVQVLMMGLVALLALKLVNYFS